MKQNRSLYWLASSAFLWCLSITTPTQAQVPQGDTTLPNDSIVTPNGKTNVITGGTQAGPNLFHSFTEFSVPTNGSASFQQVDQKIENVISRVTGSLESNINGLIEVLQANGTVSSADFFLLNPNGIIFGPNASLNIGGSFLASTASSLNFADNTQFSATDPQATPLLTVSVPSGLQFGGNAGRVLIQGSGLAVRPGSTLALVGSDIRLQGGDLAASFGTNLAAPGGRIELGSVASNSLVSLNSTNEGWSLGYRGVQSFRDIQLSQGAYVDAGGEGSGSIQVQGRRITLTDGSVVGAATKGSKPGGTLTITASNSIELTGGIDIEGGFYYSSLFNEVEAGATGPGGDLTITTKHLLVRDGALVSTRTYGEGQGGDLTVTASDSVELIGTSTDSFTGSGLFAQTQKGATGAGGNLSIFTKKLTVKDGAQANATTFGTGDAGNLTVQAADIELVGAALLADGQLLTIGGDLPSIEDDLPFPSGLFAGTGEDSTGNGGILDVQTDRLSLRDGAVLQASTLGTGDAGDLRVRASEFMELTGTAKGIRFPTSLLAVSGGIPGFPGFPKATGQGGDLKITTGNLLVQDGAAIAVGSLNPTSAAKGAGKITIKAPTISLDDEGAITAATESGQGGNIDLQVQDLLLLRDNSPISTSAGSARQGGNGGDITINTNNLVALDNSDIRANAFTGKGGNIQITTEGDFRSLDSDIDASSELGIDGVVEINTPDVDPSEGVVALPDEPVSVAVAQGCQATGSKQASVEFFNTGKGGLAPSPYEPLSSNETWEDVPQGTQNLARVAPASKQVTAQPNKLVEAQGWLVNKKGEAVLVAEVPTRSQRRCRLR